jgi:hypothetical protein
VVIVEWRLGDRSRLVLAANFSDENMPVPAAASDGRLLYASAAPFSPLSAAFYLSERPVL